MGADMLVAAVPVEVNQAQARQNLENIDQDTLIAVVDALGLEVEDNDFSLAEDLIEQGLNAIYLGSRQVATIYSKSTPIAVTGGMSWGDPPTDIYDAIQAVFFSGVTLKPKRKRGKRDEDTNDR